MFFIADLVHDQLSHMSSGILQFLQSTKYSMNSHKVSRIDNKLDKKIIMNFIQII